AALAGRGPALLVLLVGVANAIFLVPKFVEPQPGVSSQQVALAAYLLVGLALALFGGRVRLMSRRGADAEQRLRVAQDDSGIGLFEVDFAAKTVHASPVMAQLLDQPAAQ